MTTSADLLDLIEAALLGPDINADPPVYATGAGARIRRPGDLPTQDGDYPITKIRIISESRRSLGRGSVQFETTTTIRVQSEVSAPASIADVNTSDIEARLWAIKRQNEIAIINSYPLFAVVEQLASVQGQLAYSGAQATHLAGIQSDYAFEFYEGEEEFAPIEADALTSAHLEMIDHPPVGATIALPQ